MADSNEWSPKRLAKDPFARLIRTTIMVMGDWDKTFGHKKTPTRIAPSEGHGNHILTVEDQLSPQGIIQGFGVSDTGGLHHRRLGIQSHQFLIDEV